MAYMLENRVKDQYEGKPAVNEGKRNFVKALAGLGVGLAVFGLDAILPREAHAQTGSASPQTDSVDFAEYRTVDDVLRDTPYFKKIGLDDLKRETESGKTVLIVYSRAQPQEFSTNLLLVFKEASQEFQDIKFVVLEYDESRRKNYTALGFDKIPGYAFFSRGERKYLQTEGPSKAQIGKGAEITKRNLQKLRDL